MYQCQTLEDGRLTAW